MISCKEYFTEQMEQIKSTVSKMEKAPSLLIIQVGDNQASNRYVRNKIKDCENVGIKAEVLKLEQDIYEFPFDCLVTNTSKKFDGVIIQLPLPKQIDEQWAKTLIPPEKDVDGFVNPNVIPCTPKGIMDWIHYNKINLNGENVTIIGRSDLVGKPLARLMDQENATVTVCHSHTKSITEHLRHADIIVSAVGKADLITEIDLADIRTEPIIIDVGINIGQDGKLCGDCSKDLYDNYKIKYITLVPNGVGLLTRVSLLKNLIDLINNKED